ncbi:MAG: hypothetical protein ABJQ29_04820 [Luteolibacter sp.]
MKPFLISSLPVERRFQPSVNPEILQKAVPGKSIPPSNDSRIARQVGQEILHKSFDASTWAAAVAASGDRSGRGDETLAHYARIRMEQLGSQATFQNEKREALDTRRRITCLKAKVAMDEPGKTNVRAKVGLPLPPVSLAWLTILLVSSSGMVASAGRLFGGRFGLTGEIDRGLPAIALIFGVCMVGASLLLRAMLPRRAMRFGWEPGLALLCAGTSFASLYFGWKLLGQTPPDVIQALVKPQIRQTRVESRPGAEVLAEPESADVVEINVPMGEPEQ